MPVPIQQVDTDQSTTVIEALEFQPPCQSFYCTQHLNSGAHDADVIVLFDCGAMVDWCEDRYAVYLTEHLPNLGGVNHRDLKCQCKISKVIRTFEVKE